MKVNTPAHNRLMHWLKSGNTIRLVSEPGIRFGSWEGIESLPKGLSERIVFQLIDAEKLHYVTEYINGVRYERIALTDFEW